MDDGFRRLSGEWMTPRRRFLSALYGGRVDKVPAMTLSSVITLEAMDIADAAFPEAHLDADKIARPRCNGPREPGSGHADARLPFPARGRCSRRSHLVGNQGQLAGHSRGIRRGADRHGDHGHRARRPPRYRQEPLHNDVEGGGFTVINLGVNTSPDEFLEAVRTSKARLVGMSALLTTTMPNMAKTVEAFKDAGLRDQVRFMVGGAPVTPEFGKAVGADGYGKDALACVELAKKLAVEVSL